MRPRPKAAEAIILPDSSMQLSLSRYPSCPSSTWPTARRLGLHRHYPTAPPQFLNAKGYLLCWIDSACYAGSRSPKGLRCSRQGHPPFGCPDGSQEHLRWQNPAATSPQIYGGTWGIPVQSYRKPQRKNPESGLCPPRSPRQSQLSRATAEGSPQKTPGRSLRVLVASSLEFTMQSLVRAVDRACIRTPARKSLPASANPQSSKPKDTDIAKTPQTGLLLARPRASKSRGALRRPLAGPFKEKSRLPTDAGLRAIYEFSCGVLAKPSL